MTGGLFELEEMGQPVADGAPADASATFVAEQGRALARARDAHDRICHAGIGDERLASREFKSVGRRCGVERHLGRIPTGFRFDERNRAARFAGLPADDLVRTPSGRVDRAAADAAFARRRAETEANPGDWRCWFRLAVAYHDARDTPRARRAMQHAIALHAGRPPRH